MSQHAIFVIMTTAMTIGSGAMALYAARPSQPRGQRRKGATRR